MAQKFNADKLSKEELAKHLRKPNGPEGKEVGKQMNQGNKHICLNSYQILAPKPSSSILEIGMGNGVFVKDLMSMTTDLEYVGLDYSKTMVEEAIVLNKELIREAKVRFIEGSIEKLPFEDESFDCVTTTNTIYFWPNLKENTREIFRVLKPGGKVLIGYRSKALMDKIEFTKYGFNKFENSTVENLLKDNGFKSIHTKILQEPDLDFDGKKESIEGLYTTGEKI